MQLLQSRALPLGYPAAPVSPFSEWRRFGGYSKFSKPIKRNPKPGTVHRAPGAVGERFSLPKMPSTTPHHPDAKKEIGNGVSGHSIAQALLPANETLVSCGAKYPGQPLIMDESEED